jgi:rubrerythrin
VRVSSTEAIVGLLENHATAEEKSLEAYRTLAQSNDPVIALLVGLILKDEETHHGLMRDILATMSQSPYWRSRGEILPQTGRMGGPEAQQTAIDLGHFIEEEKETQRSLKELADKTKDQHDGIDSFLLELMGLDSKKHERILAFLVRRLAPGLLPDYLDLAMTRLES